MANKKNNVELTSPDPTGPKPTIPCNKVINLSIRDYKTLLNLQGQWDLSFVWDYLRDKYSLLISDKIYREDGTHYSRRSYALEGFGKVIDFDFKDFFNLKALDCIIFKCHDSGNRAGFSANYTAMVKSIMFLEHEGHASKTMLLGFYSQDDTIGNVLPFDFQHLLF